VKKRQANFFTVTLPDVFFMHINGRFTFCQNDSH